MLQLGKINRLKVLSKNNRILTLEYGVTLSSTPEDQSKIGEELDVFVYLDSNDKPVGTWKIPYAQVGDFAYLRVVETLDFGAFLDLGIEKHLLVPGNQQKIKMEYNEYYLVKICLEERTHKIFGTSKIERFLEREEIDLTRNQEVSLLPFEFTDKGVKVIIDNLYQGMIYKNEIFSPVNLGQVIPGFVKEIRPDGLIDASIRPVGIKNLSHGQDEILKALNENGGFLPLHDKSNPAEIKKVLNMSKQTFKRAVGMLYKARKITISDKGIKLIQ